MTVEDRWLLPNGVDEVLPQEAQRIEALRRQLLDLYASWGYELVIPPMIEYQESLLIGLGSDIDLQTFRLVDQLSGRTLALRADITPQVARIDAHSMCREEPSRFCYVGTVLHTKPKTAFASRTPIEVGAELYGDKSHAGDCEVICLMLETLKVAGISKLHLDIGHVGIFRALAQQVRFSDDQESILFDALQRKASAEIDDFVSKHVKDKVLADMLLALSQLNGERGILDKAQEVFAKAPPSVLQAVDTLVEVSDTVTQRLPEVEIYFDLSELRGYHYHTGLVFGAFTPGLGEAVANGGRYDGVGEVFGRGRPATGFSADLKSMIQLQARSSVTPRGIFAPGGGDASQWHAVQQLRKRGERVVCGLSGQAQENSCDRRLVQKDGTWQVVDN